jgi:hypothetical protein
VSAACLIIRDVKKPAFSHAKAGAVALAEFINRADYPERPQAEIKSAPYE